MSFTAGIPMSGQSLGNSRTQVVNNFAILRSTLAVNHEDVNDGSNGKHTFVQWSVQGSDPTTAASEIARYTKLVSGAAREHIRQPSDGAVIQMTGPDPTIAASGFTFLPGGMGMNWGTATVTGSLAIVYTQAFSAASYSIQTTQFNSGASTIREWGQVFASSSTGFTLRSIESGGNVSGTARTFFWMAIGAVA